MVVRFRFAVGVAMIWVAAVAGVSATAWVVIDRAGRDVTVGDVSALVPAPVGTSAATSTTGSGPSPTGSTPTASPSSASSATSGAGGTAPAGATPPRDRTVTIAGGQVSVRCTAAAITLRIAQPDNGWTVDVDKSGPAEVEVTFERGDGESRVRSRVKALCSAGAPVFTVENKS